MRRTLWTLAVFIALGVVSSVAIALVFAAYEREMTGDPPLTAAMRRAQWADARTDDADEDWWLHSAYSAMGSDIVIRNRGRDFHQVRRAGLPWRAVQAFVDGDVSRGARSSGTVISRYGIALRTPIELFLDMPSPAIPPPVYANTVMILPLCPAWPGFALDTLFWAAALWVLWMIPSWIRSAAWFGLRRCTHCGYRTGTSSVCTECGTPIRFRSWSQPRSTSGCAARLDA